MGGNFQEVVSGAFASFFRKYGDLADRINLCRLNDLSGDATFISEVLGWSLVNKEVIWEAKGCKGSVDFE